ncbi:threonine synthase [Sciscionella marina]|uniref:threonine synthase n=1 Tax=Sciscionella marina TaxID=508770 RepID=UPI0003A20A06|nr:pyridoxal-phosphate dependent enzyme [Sciscionella marina]
MAVRGRAARKLAYPVEVDYEYGQVPEELFPGSWRGDGLERWAPLLPPLLAPGLGEGGTPLVQLAGDVYVKDESRNPTWSHKDRLNRCAVSAAVGVGAEGIVVASSGNHGASAAAYAARAGLRCVVLASAGAPPAVESFLRAYGATVLTVPADARWPLLRRIVTEFGYHPVSNSTLTHTGHAFGAEGYKTIAYEIFADLGVPDSVFVPTGYGEVLFGVWKGFVELNRIGRTDRIPRMFSCEPAAGGPLAQAIALGRDAMQVSVGSTAAYAIDTPVGGYRGVRTVRESGGAALLVDDAEMTRAQNELCRNGLWQELSATAGLAGFRKRAQSAEFPGPVVCIATSSGFKDQGVATGVPDVTEPEWETVREAVRRA